MVYREIKKKNNKELSSKKNSSKKKPSKKTRKPNFYHNESFTSSQLKHSLKSLIYSEHLKLIVNVEKDGSKLKAISLEGVDLTPLFTKDQLKQLFTDDKSCKVHQEFFNPDFPTSFEKGIIDKYTLEDAFNDNPWHLDAKAVEGIQNKYGNYWYHKWEYNWNQCEENLCYYMNVNRSITSQEMFDSMYPDGADPNELLDVVTKRYDNIEYIIKDPQQNDIQRTIDRHAGITLQKDFIEFCISNKLEIQTEDLLVQFVFNYDDLENIKGLKYNTSQGGCMIVFMLLLSSFLSLLFLIIS